MSVKLHEAGCELSKKQFRARKKSVMIHNARWLAFYENMEPCETETDK